MLILLLVALLTLDESIGAKLTMPNPHENCSPRRSGRQGMLFIGQENKASVRSTDKTASNQTCVISFLHICVSALKLHSCAIQMTSLQTLGYVRPFRFSGTRAVV